MAMQALFHELAVHQDVQKKLQQEIDEYCAEHDAHDEHDPALLAKLGLLQACINEALRLWPPVASGTQRITPPEGLFVGDAFIPGNMAVQVPSYLIHRSTYTPGISKGGLTQKLFCCALTL